MVILGAKRAQKKLKMIAAYTVLPMKGFSLNRL